MSAPAFTRGAWGILATSKERGTQVRASMGDGTFKTICYALNGDADGRLIAAAPALYEVLETLIKRTPFKPAEGGINLFLSLEQIAEHRALLAKARGEWVSPLRVSPDLR